MKPSIFATSVILLLGSANVMAQQDPSTEQVLGAIAGGAIGSTIGDGDGKKVATVIGAILGYRMGERILDPNYRKSFSNFDNDDFRLYCSNNVPVEYEDSDRLSKMYINGCVSRLQRKQRELERQAYLDGLQGN